MVDSTKRAASQLNGPWGAPGLPYLHLHLHAFEL